MALLAAELASSIVRGKASYALIGHGNSECGDGRVPDSWNKRCAFPMSRTRQQLGWARSGSLEWPKFVGLPERQMNDASRNDEFVAATENFLPFMCRIVAAHAMDTSAGAVTGASSSEKDNQLRLPEKRILVGFGGLCMDYLASVDRFPNPDDKIRSTSFQVQGGGCVGNALTAAARLGLNPRTVSKVADDGPGKQILAELEAEGIDISNIVVAPGGNSAFTYIIVDEQQKTRTCIHTPISSTFAADDLSEDAVRRALHQADLVYFDGRFGDAALVVANQAARLQIPVLVDAENFKRDKLTELLGFADYVVCSSNFPMGWTGTSNLAEALLAMALNLPQMKFLIVTLGGAGCVMLERAITDPREAESMDVQTTLESLKQEVKQRNNKQPSVASSKVGRLRTHASGGQEVAGRLLLGTAEEIPPAELVDTTGAGDAFIGGVMYSLCAGYPVEKMLPLAAVVAASCCRGLGARTSLPLRVDSKLLPFL